MGSKSNRSIVALRGATLTYGSVRALNRVSIEIFSGEIHAVVGEHGAGKSSLGLILGGLVEPDSGFLEIGGRFISRYSTRRALTEGIVMVRQSPNIFPHRSVLDNIWITHTSFTHGLLASRKKRRLTVAGFLQMQGVQLDLDALVKDLKLSDQVLLEIMRGLFISPRLLILDESLEKLTSQDLTIVVDLLKEHADKGNSVLFITHRIDDIFRIADRVSVVKKGDLMLTEPIESMDKFSLIKIAYTQYPVSDDDTVLDSEFYHLLKYNQAILQNLPVNLLAINNDGIVKLINACACEFLKTDNRSVQGRSIYELFAGEDEFLLAVDEGRRDDRITTLYQRVLCKKSEPKIVNVTVLPIRDETWPIGSLLMIDDVTEQEHLRESVHFNDKLESIGLLAAGVAHEINNPMEIILNNVEYLESIYKDKIDVGVLREISEEINAVSEIVGTLSIAGNEREQKISLIDAKIVISSLIKLLYNFAQSKHITIDQRFETKIAMVRARQGELRQIVLNLIKNSIEAMNEGGSIIVEMKRLSGRIVITVTDSGPGIDTAFHKDVFLPFFTTKLGDSNKRGLGLYMAYKLAQKNSGEIRLDTEYQSGCRIELNFPDCSPEYNIEDSV